MISCVPCGLHRKILTTLVSLFSSSFVFGWPTFFGDVKLKYPPSFDARVVCYPTDQTLKDYIAWRQVDCTLYLRAG